MATKRIKFIKPWGMVPAGAVREFDSPIADLLIQRGRAEEVQAASMRLVTFGETVGELIECLQLLQLPTAKERRMMSVKKYWKPDTPPAQKPKKSKKAKKVSDANR